MCRARVKAGNMSGKIDDLQWHGMVFVVDSLSISQAIKILEMMKGSLLDKLTW